MRTVKYFAYGSNMNPDRMKSRGVKFLRRIHAVLNGWRLEFNKVSFRNPREGYANIVRDENSIVEGILYEILDSDIGKLDRYEGYPDHYDRITVKVRLDNGSEIEAFTYIAQPDKVRSGLKPSKEYLNHLLKGSDLLSKEYRDRLSKLETLNG